jgi:HAD superfamily hydrolase (TIGR01450 family)
VVFDVDGCLTLQGEAIPGAGEALAAVESRGISWLIATNNSTRTPAAVAAHLSELLGRQVSAERVITSAQAAVALLSPEHAPALVVGEEGLVAALAVAGIAVTADPVAARSVVVGLDRAFDYQSLSRAGRAVARGAFLVASNADRTFPDPAGDLPGAGAILAAIEAVGGRKAVVAGKPHPPMLQLVASRLRPGVTWVVGDRPDTDIGLARAGGWVGVLVLTGICRDPSLIAQPLRPDFVIRSVADLPGLL